MLAGNPGADPGYFLIGAQGELQGRCLLKNDHNDVLKAQCFFFLDGLLLMKNRLYSSLSKKAT